MASKSGHINSGWSQRSAGQCLPIVVVLHLLGVMKLKNEVVIH